MTKRRKMLVADLLCGAGGSSTGAARALGDLGLEMELVCVNHWPIAIETHKKNHPQARHYCQDISTVRPHLIVPEGYLDLLMASPTCTHHSSARGGKPTSDQQRSDPWHIVTWLTELRVTRVLIENVPEFVSWGPVDPRTGKPIKARKGEYFQAWCDSLRRLGFVLEHRILTAADYGDATTRRRFFMQGRSDGKPITWPAASHARRQAPSVVALPRPTRTWRPAREIIDWSIRGLLNVLHRELPQRHKLHLFGVKGTAIAELAGHPRIHSVDSMAWDAAARREKGDRSCTVEYRSGHMRRWYHTNVAMLSLPQLRMAV